jgi:hypothetical protein
MRNLHLIEATVTLFGFVLPSYSQMSPTVGQSTQAAWMMPGGMGGLMFAPVVSPDGTTYLVKTQILAGAAGMMGGTAANLKTQLVAILAGSVSWTLDLDGWMISRPVLAPDGNILLSESFPPDFVFGLSGSQANGQDRNAKLLIITPMGNAAQIVAQTQVDTDALSAPGILPMPDGSYRILATGFDMGGMMSALFGGRLNSSQKTSLCMFDSTGNLLSEVAP